MRTTLFTAALLATVSPLLFTGGCQTASIAMWEKLGYAKREQLVERVEEARDSQQEAKEQFQSALEQFQALTGFTGGELGERYSRLQREHDRSKAAADEVKTRIDKIEGVAEALFEEWEKELEQYSDSSMRAAARRQERETKNRYNDLLAAMRQAEGTMEPVLRRFADRVLFLKHNLNAQAVASLSGEQAVIESDVERLVAEMSRAIEEADAFIGQMKRE